MNGAAEPYRANKKLQPGSEIFVPTKGEATGKVWDKVIGSTSIFSSIASMTTAMAILLRYAK